MKKTVKNAKISKITQKDIARLKEIEADCFSSLRENFESVLASENYVYLKAELDGEIVGYVGASIICEESDLNFVAVAKDKRRLGIARQLMLAIMNEAKARGANEMMLEVNVNNEAALALYKSLGFAKISERKNYYGKDSAIVMKKTL